MIPAEYHWQFIAGDQATLPGTITLGSGSLFNLTGCSAVLEIRTGDKTTPLVLQASTANGKIILGGSAGTFVVTLTATDTAALVPAGVSNKTYRYDLKIIDSSGATLHWVEGMVKVKNPVTA